MSKPWEWTEEKQRNLTGAQRDAADQKHDVLKWCAGELCVALAEIERIDKQRVHERLSDRQTILGLEQGIYERNEEIERLQQRVAELERDLDLWDPVIVRCREVFGDLPASVQAALLYTSEQKPAVIRTPKEIRAAREPQACKAVSVIDTAKSEPLEHKLGEKP